MPNGDLNGKNSLVKTVIQGGGIGLALVAIALLYLLASNHIAHNTQVLVEVSESSKAQVAATEDLVDVVKELKFYISRDVSASAKK